MSAAERVPGARPASRGQRVGSDACTYHHEPSDGTSSPPPPVADQYPRLHGQHPRARRDEPRESSGAARRARHSKGRSLSSRLLISRASRRWRHRGPRSPVRAGRDGSVPDHRGEMTRRAGTAGAAAPGGRGAQQAGRRSVMKKPPANRRPPRAGGGRAGPRQRRHLAPCRDEPVEPRAARCRAPESSVSQRERVAESTGNASGWRKSPRRLRVVIEGQVAVGLEGEVVRIGTGTVAAGARPGTA